MEHFGPPASGSLRQRLRHLQSAGRIGVHERVDLREWTALRVGGAADLLIRMHSEAALTDALDLLASHGLRWLVVGAGSRLVVPDDGVRVPVVSLTADLAGWSIDLDGVEAGGGARLRTIGGALARAGLSGLERLFGTRGSVGGILSSVLRGGERVLAGLVEWAEVARPGSPLTHLAKPAEREKPWFSGVDDDRTVVVRGRFTLRPDRPAAIHDRTELAGDQVAWRPRSSAPLFVDPPEGVLTAMLDEAGCRGLTVRGAACSDVEPNLVVTNPRARAEDVLGLCRVARERVLARCGVELEPALVFVDSEGRRLEP